MSWIFTFELIKKRLISKISTEAGAKKTAKDSNVDAIIDIIIGIFT